MDGTGTDVGGSYAVVFTDEQGTTGTITADLGLEYDGAIRETIELYLDDAREQYDLTGGDALARCQDLMLDVYLQFPVVETELVEPTPTRTDHAPTAGAPESAD